MLKKYITLRVWAYFKKQREKTLFCAHIHDSSLLKPKRSDMFERKKRRTKKMKRMKKKLGHPYRILLHTINFLFFNGMAPTKQINQKSF